MCLTELLTFDSLAGARRSQICNLSVRGEEIFYILSTTLSMQYRHHGDKSEYTHHKRRIATRVKNYTKSSIVTFKEIQQQF